MNEALFKRAQYVLFGVITLFTLIVVDSVFTVFFRMTGL